MENFWPAPIRGLAATYILSDRVADAKVAATEVLRINPEFCLEHFAKTLPFKNKADTDLYIDSLRKAGLNK
jgi:hypothetical protein